MTTYKFGEIVLVEFPQTGSARRKRRPALVVLDIGDLDIILAPITTTDRSGRGDYKLRDWRTCGLLRDSWVRLAKIACLEKSDITRRLGQLTNHDKEMVVKLWQALFALSRNTE